MRWWFVVWALGCAGQPRPPPVAIQAPTPTLAPGDDGVTIDGSAIVCGATRTELPDALMITTTSHTAVTAASRDGVLAVATSTNGDLFHAWAELHRELEGPLANDAQLDATLTFRGGTLVIDYAMAHSARLRFAYRRTDRCTLTAIERVAEPSGAVEAVVATSPTPASARDCLAHRRTC